MDVWNENRRAHAAAYRERLEDLVELPSEVPRGSATYQLFAIRSHDRDALSAALQARRIGTGIHYPLALPDQPAVPMLRGADTPVARDWAARELSLPMFPGLTAAGIDTICEAIAGR